MAPKRTTARRPGRFAIIVSRFNEDITDNLLKGALACLRRHGIAANRIETFRVPGAFEIPAVAGRLARMRRYDGVICLGAVIRGETPHFEYISHAVSQSLCDIAAEFGLPLGFGILTTENERQARERADPRRHDRGGEAAGTALAMAQLLRSLS